MKKKNKNKCFVPYRRGFSRILCALILVCVFCLLLPSSSAYAETETSDLEKSLGEAVDSQLGGLDFSELDNYIASLEENQKELFGSGSFYEKVKEILNGETPGAGSFIGAFFKATLSQFTGFLPSFCAIAGVSILLGIIGNLKPKENSSLAEVVYFACYGVVLVLTVAGVLGLLKDTQKVVNGINSQMQIIFPVLLSVMAGLGAASSVAVYKPAVALLSGGMIQLISYVVLPLVTLTFVFSIVSNMSKDIKLGKTVGFLESASVWVVCVSFTVFMAFMSVNGITAGVSDGISVRAAKFALSSYVPILGGYLSEGFNVLMAGGVLIKNSVGLCGVILLLCYLVVPVVKISLFMLGLKLVAAIVEPVTDPRIPSFLTMVSKNLKMLIVCIVGVGFMYFITVMLMILSCNYIV